MTHEFTPIKVIMKTNPKKDKSARRKRNPLPTVAFAPYGRHGGLYKKVEQCKKCTLRSAVTPEGLCVQCK